MASKNKFTGVNFSGNLPALIADIDYSVRHMVSQTSDKFIKSCLLINLLHLVPAALCLRLVSKTPALVPPFVSLMIGKGDWRWRVYTCWARKVTITLCHIQVAHNFTGKTMIDG